VCAILLIIVFNGGRVLCAQTAIEFFTDHGIPAFRTQYPGPVLPGWAMAHMPGVPTCQFCHPVAVIVLLEPEYLLFHDQMLFLTPN